MSTPELVNLTIDGQEIQVPKGTGVVETALSAGIEIPVFCYEPRLGPPVGACRMCLVEIEGLPKLQAACTLTAQEGMAVKTAATSTMAAEGQGAVLEFILLNHPLDCPDCDKGGECPLQDLTFRFGPGSTRMAFQKRTFDKPIPISPLIALDRERCILCYRCTRFSELVAEDGQLVARERGANSYITTFEQDPYRAHFTGNVIELCPVGALTSTVYRFRGRPWEIQNVPTVCGMCPVGCNTWATTREGKVARVLSRNHPEVDGGWLCDKGRFTHDHLVAPDRIREPLQRVRRHGFDPVSWEDALAAAETGLRDASGSVVVVFSGHESVEQAAAISLLVRQGLGSDAAILPDDVDPALEAFGAPLSTIGSAELCLVLGDEPVLERAPIVDLWLRAARREGAEVVTAHPSGSLPVPPGSAAAVAEALGSDSPPEELRDLARRLRQVDRVALIWSEGDPTGGRHLALLAGRLELGEGSGAYYLPGTPNGRGVAAAWRAAGDGRRQEPPVGDPVGGGVVGVGDPVGGGTAGEIPEGEIGALIVSGDEALDDPRVLDLAERARYVLTTSMFMSEVTGQSHLVVPGTSYLERDGTTVNLEGRPQRQRRAVQPPGWDELEFFARLAQRFGLEVDPWAHPAPGDHAALPPRNENGGLAGDALVGKPVSAPEGKFALVRYRPLFVGPAVERIPQLEFQRPEAEVELSYGDARDRGIKAGDRVRVSSDGTAHALTAKLNRRLLPGVVRIAAEHAHGLGAIVEITRDAG